VALAPDTLCDPDQVPQLRGTWHVAGAGWQRYAVALQRSCGQVTGATPLEVYPHAEDVAQLAARAYEQGAGVGAAAVQPVYLRQKVAQKASSGTGRT
jgi:tRNA threonylcarbamoyladenosine biosynthesis protein TsaB